MLGGAAVRGVGAFGRVWGGARALSTAAHPRVKHKSTFKRASATMADINKEAEVIMRERMAKHRGAPLPEFDVGDAVELTYTTEVGESRAVAVRGTVIAKRNKGISSSFSIINSFDDDLYIASYPFNSPLLKKVSIMQKWRVHDGRKRPRRAKLYYLKDRLPKDFKVDAKTTEKTNSAWAARQARQAAAKKASQPAPKPRTRL